MARNRQRAKQRQAERRAARLAPTSDPLQGDDPLEEAELAAGAPPSDLGFSDATVESEAPHDDLDDEGDFDEEDFEDELEDDGGRGDGGAGGGGRGEQPGRAPRGDDPARHGRRRHNRLVAFLIAVWAELQRVEWPDRQTLTMLTGVVLLFVIVMGAYLGLLDAIFSKVINKIL
jgi:preprotein translocase subunit SecE